MDVTIKTRKLCAGSYEIDTPTGTYRLENCPTDRSDFRTAGLPSGPRWMLTWPGAHSADSEFPTKRAAIESIRANEQWTADQAAIPPRRGDQVEAWLKAERNKWPERTDRWELLDQLLDDYRLHADTGTPLDRHCCENGTVDDCHGCYQEAQQR